MVTHAATLDVPRHVVAYLSRLLAAHRRRIGTPRGSRALGPFRQALLVLRWFRERGCVHWLARDAGVSQATGYRYLHEGIDVLADQAPDLHQILDRCRREGMTQRLCASRLSLPGSGMDPVSLLLSFVTWADVTAASAAGARTYSFPGTTT